MRFNKNEGNFAVNKKNHKEEDLKSLVENGLKVGEVTLSVNKSTP